MHLIKCFPIHEKIKQFWCHQMCKLYQNITSRLMFMIVFGNDCNFFIVLPIPLKTCRYNDFFFFTPIPLKTCRYNDFFFFTPIPLKNCRYNGFFLFTCQSLRARKIGRVSEVLNVWLHRYHVESTPDIMLNLH